MQKKGFRKILIIILVILILIIVYVWYSSRPAKIQPRPDAAVVSVPLPTGQEAGEKNQLPQAKEIIRILSLLNKVKLDVDFFNSKSFKSLNDFSVQLPSLTSGRSNPFAPLETGLPAQAGSE
ncbi:MAG: hypothetical protein HY773_01500 [Candidatus Terrybacteria bacterium]|nr:hypothetical protein [Candidatus Terrybacteria bacterium]